MKITDKHGNIWVLAPEDAVNTQSQKGVACKAVSSFKLNYYEVDEIYRAMIAAAPEPELSTELETVGYVYTDGGYSEALLPDEIGRNNLENNSNMYAPLVLRSDAEAIIVQMLSEQDCNYNRKTNTLIKRHAEQIAQKDSEISELKAALVESRANDRCGMEYLSRVRKAVGGKDFPDMCERAERQAKLVEQCREALEYASDMTKPEGLSGCDCMICSALAAIEKETKE